MDPHRAQNTIKHCRITHEDRLFIIGSASFESLAEFITYYGKHPLYREVRLIYPITKEIARMHCFVSL